MEKRWAKQKICMVIILMTWCWTISISLSLEAKLINLNNQFPISKDEERWLLEDPIANNETKLNQNTSNLSNINFESDILMEKNNLTINDKLKDELLVREGDITIANNINLTNITKYSSNTNYSNNTNISSDALTITLPKLYNGFELLNSQFSILLRFEKKMGTQISIFFSRNWNYSSIGPNYYNNAASPYGEWDFLMSNPKLTCNLLFNKFSHTFGFLKLNQQNQPLYLTIGNLTSFSSEFQFLNESDQINISQNIILDQNCNFIYLKNSSDTKFFKFKKINNSSSIAAIQTPSNFYYDQLNLNFYYLISQGKLYKLTADSHYTQQNYKWGNSTFQFIKNYADSYKIQNYSNRLIIQISNNSQSNIKQLQIFIDDLKQGLILISNQSSKSFIFKSSTILYSKTLTLIAVIQNYTEQKIVKIISIDFENRKLTNVLFYKQGSGYNNTLSINKFAQVVLNNNILVIRDTASANVDPNYKLMERIFVILKNKIIPFHQRNINTVHELSQFLGNYPYLGNKNQINLASIYNVSGQYIYEYRYYGPFLQIKNQTVNSMVNITLINISNSIMQTNPLRLLYTQHYKNPFYSIVTQFQQLIFDYSKNKFIQSYNFSVYGYQQILSSNSKCFLTINKQYVGMEAFFLHQYDSYYKNYTKNYISFQNLYTNYNYNITYTSKISSNCKLISINQKVYNKYSYMVGYYLINNMNFTNLKWINTSFQLDFILYDYGIASILSQTYDSFYVAYQLYNQYYKLGNQIFSWHNGVIVKYYENNRVSILGLVKMGINGQLKLFFNFTTQNYASIDKKVIIQFSPQLTKVMISGFVKTNQISSSVNIQTYFFHLDFDKQKYVQIQFPNVIRNPQYTTVILQQNWIYLRQNYNMFKEEYFYFNNYYYQQVFRIDQSLSIKLAYKSKLTGKQTIYWKKTYLLVHFQFQDELNILTEEYINSVIPSINQTIILKTITINFLVAQRNSQSITPISFIYDGVCPIGCGKCIQGKCSNSIIGYHFDQYSNKLVKCQSSCENCDEFNSTICLSCIEGTYLSQTSCVPCSNNCLTCISQHQCQSCPFGKYLQNESCISCPKNCQKCTSLTTCTRCSRGFALLSNGKCIGCLIGCPKCNPLNITQCISCDNGQQLLNNVCSPCPQNCSKCTNNYCIICKDGFTQNNGNCIEGCNYPCKICSKSGCVRCYDDSLLVDGRCYISLSCNSAASCSNCGYILGYYLESGICKKCPQINHCIQCVELNPNLCGMCETGYYLQQNYSCLKCPVGCTSCLGPLFCNRCSSGFTLSNNQILGKCISCESPCVECQGSSSACISCITGYNKLGWKCQKDKYLQFNFVIQTNMQTILANMNMLTYILLSYLNENPQNFETITYNYIGQGSVMLNGSYTPKQNSLANADSNLQSAISSNKLGQYAVLYYQTAIIGQAATSNTTTQQSSSIVGIIVGVLVGVFVVIVIIVFLCIYYFKSKQAEANNAIIVKYLEHHQDKNMDHHNTLGTNSHLADSNELNLEIEHKMANNQVTKESYDH